MTYDKGKIIKIYRNGFEYENSENKRILAVYRGKRTIEGIEIFVHGDIYGNKMNAKHIVNLTKIKDGSCADVLSELKIYDKRFKKWVIEQIKKEKISKDKLGLIELDSLDYEIKDGQRSLDVISSS